MATNPTPKTWPNRPLTMDDIAYCEENGCGFPVERYYSFPPEGHRHRLRTSGLKTPIWEFKGPSTQGRWKSTGCTDERDAMVFMWEHAQVGVLLGEALKMVPCAESTKKHDRALLTYFHADYPLKQLSHAVVEKYIDARRKGIFGTKTGKRRRGPKDSTIRRDIERLHFVLTDLQSKDLFHGNLASLHQSSFNLTKDKKHGKGVFINEYDSIRASIPKEGLRLVLDFLTVFAADECAAHRARGSDIHLERTPQCPEGYIEIHGSKTEDRGKPKPFNAQTRAFVVWLQKRLLWPDAPLFPELISRNGTRRSFGEIIQTSWPQAEAYKDKGLELTCMALRRTCFTFMRRYLSGDDCNLYLGHAPRGVEAHYDQHTILDLAPKPADLRFPFIPDVDDSQDDGGADAGGAGDGVGGSIAPAAAAGAESRSGESQIACDASATGSNRAQVPETSRESSRNMAVRNPYR